MTLSEIRAKYPEYDHLSDQQLADALHNKYYSNMPKDEFYSRIKFSVKKPSNESSEGPSLFGQPLFKENLSDEQFKQRIKDKLLNPIKAAGAGAADALMDVGSGLNRGITAAINPLIQGLGGKGFAPAGKPYSFSEMEKGHPIATAVGSAAPFLIAPGLKVAQGAGVLPAMANMAATSALYSGLASAGNKQNTPLDIAKATTLGGVLGGGLGGVSHAIAALPAIPKAIVEKVASHLKNQSELHPEEIAKRAQNLKEIGMPVSAPDIVGGSASRRYHSIIGNIPFSGIKNDEANLLKNAKQYTDNFVEDLRGNVPESALADHLSQRVKYKFNAINDKKRSIYSGLSDLAKQHDLRVNNENTINAAQDILNEIKNTPKSDQVKIPPELKKELSTLVSSSPHARPTFNQAQFKLSDYQGNIREAEKANQGNLARIYKKLEAAKNKDINGAVEKSGIPELKEGWSKADQFYKEHYVPYMEKDIKNILNEKVDGQTLANTLLKHKNRQVLNHLSADDKKKLLHMKLGHAKGIAKDEFGNLNVSPLGVANAYKNIPISERLRLGGPEIEKEMQRMESLGRTLSESKLSQHAPATGYRTVGDLLYSILGGGALHMFGASNPATVKAIGSAIVGGRLLRKLANSDALLNALSSEKRSLMNINVPSQHAKAAMQAAKLLGGSLGSQY